MKTLVIYYSYTGKTKRLAKELAAKETAETAEVKDINRPGTLKAYSLGCFAAMRGKPWPIQPMDIDFAKYDRLILFAPVWAGNPPPAIHAVLEGFPEGKTVSVKMVSASGRSNCRERLEAVLAAKGCTFEGLEDIKA